MNKTQVIEKIRETGIIPVIRTDSAQKAKVVIKALIEGGIDVLEVTLTIPGAIEFIAELAEEYKNSALIGAGTVLDENSARKCIEAGAKFIVSPIFDAATVSFCNRNEIVVMPGAITPTEIFTAWRAGADIVKIFPVSAVGGISFLKAVKTVFPQIQMIPTGGVNLENAIDYIKAGALAVGMGSELTREQESVITKNAQNLRDIIRRT